MFFHFIQNNSEGVWVNDDDRGVCSDIIIESRCAIDASKRLGDIVSEVEGGEEYCDCCGERWGDPHPGTLKPMVWGELIEKSKAFGFRKRCFVHPLEGPFYEHKFD